LSELSVTFPFREVVSARTEVDQDASAEQRPSAQSAADVDWLLLLLPPHPAASVASATTAMRQALPRRVSASPLRRRRLG